MQNLRTPQNINNVSLNMYSNNSNSKIKEQLPGIQQNRGSSNPRNAEESELVAGNAYHYKKRNASGNTRNLISMHGLGTLNG